MPDVFISYSRRDQDLVRRLNEALTSLGKDAWVDWEDIPPTADWFREIQRGIRETTAFVFVISPDSLASEVCAREIEYAAEQSKRIVPVLARPISDLVPPEPVGRHNWIDFTNEATWDSSLATLVEALETDLAHLESHTKWQVDATRWMEGSRGKSTLLRGRELAAAEQWLEVSRAEGLHPEPTPLQFDYILAGRRASTRRARMMSGAVLLGLVITAILGVVALAQRNEARDERRTAQSREVSANALLNLPTDPELSLLLARTAVEIEPTRQAQDALRQALLESRVRMALRDRAGPVRDVAMSPTGETIATADGQGITRLWDAESGKLLFRLEDRKWLGSHWPVTQVRFARNGAAVAALVQDGTVSVWDVQSGRLLRRIVDPGDRRINSFAVSSDGQFVAIANSRHEPDLWNVETGRRVRRLRGCGYDTVEFSPNGRLILVAGGKSACLFSVASGELGARMESGPDFSLRSAATFSPDGRRIATAGADHMVRIWNTAGSLLATFRGHRSDVTALAFSPDNQLLASGGADRTVRVWDVKAAQLAVLLAGHEQPISDLRFSPDNAVVATASEDGTARLWDANTGRSLYVLRGHRGQVNAVAFSRAGDQLVTGGDDGSARVWASSPDAFAGATTKKQATRLPPGMLSRSGEFLLASDLRFVDDELSAVDVSLYSLRTEGAIARFTGGPELAGIVALSDDGTTAINTRSDGGTDLVSTRDGHVIRNLADAEVQTAAFAPDGKSVALGRPNRLDLVGIRDGKRSTHSIPGPPLRRGEQRVLWDINFNARGNRLITASPDNARLWDVATGRVIRDFNTSAYPGGMAIGATADFSPDGNRVITTVQWNNRAVIWDAASGERIGELASNATRAPHFSPDGAMVVTAGLSGATVWDVASAKPLASLQPDKRPRSINDLDSPGGPQAIFSPDGRKVHLLGEPSVSYSCDVCGTIDEILGLARTRVTRQLDAAERASFLHE